MSLLKWAGVGPDRRELLPQDPVLVPKVEEENYLSLRVHFESEDDVQAFAKLLGRVIDSRTRVVWWPSDQPMNDASLLNLLEDDE